MRVSFKTVCFLLAATLGIGLLTGCSVRGPYTRAEADPAQRQFLDHISQALEQKWTFLDAGIQADDSRVKICNWQISMLVDLACAEPEPVFNSKTEAYAIIKEWEKEHKKQNP